VSQEEIMETMADKQTHILTRFQIIGYDILDDDKTTLRKYITSNTKINSKFFL